MTAADKLKVAEDHDRRASARRSDAEKLIEDLKLGLVTINHVRTEKERLMLLVGFHTIQAALWRKSAEMFS